VTSDGEQSIPRTPVPQSPVPRMLFWRRFAATWKRLPPRRLRAIGLGAALFCASLVLFYVIRMGALQVRVTGEFGALARGEYYHIVSAPLRVRVGSDAQAMVLPPRLDRAGLRRVRERPGPGEFRASADAIEYCPPASDASDGDASEGVERVRLELDGNIVSRIDVNGGQRAFVDLLPEHLTSFRNSLWERRAPGRYEEFPRSIVMAVLAAEDRRFFAHHGIDSRGIGRALWRNVRHGRVVEGGSTITQQVVKLILHRRGRSLGAKVDEALLAVAIERRFTKEQILQVYLNEVYLGQEGPFAIHGVSEGARYFFSKPVAMLSQSEQVQLAASIRAPNAASPRRNRDRLEPYADAVTQALSAVQTPAPEEDRAPSAERGRDSADGVPLAVRGGRLDFGASQMAYYFDLLSREWEPMRRRHRIQAPATIVAGVDPVMQLRAARALQDGLVRMRNRSKAAKRDSTHVQGAVVALDPATGIVRALVGGDDYGRAPFNRAVDISRPVGSTFKPFVYLTALGGRGDSPRITQSSWLPDEPREYQVGRQTWSPANFDGNYRGWVTVREALAQSLNAATVALGMEIVGEVRDLAVDLGVQDRIPANPSILLGAVNTSPIRLAGAYAALANGGWKVTPHTLIEVRRGEDLWRSTAEGRRQLLEPQATYIVTDMLVAALRRGTGRSVERYGFSHLATGKTGTTDGMRDAWFAGYTPELVGTVWVGHDDNRETDLTGARAALPVWANLMRGWLGQCWDADFEPPPGIVFSRIDPQTGELAADGCPEAEYAAYLDGTSPRQTCSEHSGWWGGGHDAATDSLQGQEPNPLQKRGFWSKVKDAIGT
jgi:penicillin-binding protein 1B